MAAPGSLDESIQQHYASADLATVILAALAEAGKDLDHLTPEDLAPIDEFHIRGREATLELAHAAGVDASQHMLDVGSGLGGAARYLASAFGCRVMGVDLTDEYCRSATLLAERCRLSHLVEYRQGDALALPFSDDTFDIVWSQHAAMNIPDKARLYREMHRLLKPGGRLAIYDVLQGPGGPVHFPVPWARSPETSFLVSPEELRRHLLASGFQIVSWVDQTAEARDWFAALARRLQQSGPPVLGFHLFLGADFQAMAQNQTRNLNEGRIVLAQIVARK